LYGPPGTGKTFLARAVAGELNLPFYMITSADVFGRYVGDSEKNILRIFQEARKHKLSVIFIDEMETIFRKRTDDIHEVTQKVISVILQEMDGVVKHKNPILLLGATNMRSPSPASSSPSYTAVTCASPHLPHSASTATNSTAQASSRWCTLAAKPHTHLNPNRPPPTR
ncbi:MAG: AAA family ATPase, partial [Bacteroidaceae bacterium]|nr:AAA family ATPase [Bacteroidaceae bacterium]